MEPNRHAILCVDDEKNILSALRRLLRKEDYILYTASNVEDGLNLLKQHSIQLVISDQRMPEMSGTQFLARVKTEHPEILRIILTGHTDIDSIMDSINEGSVYKFFMKPWNDQNLRLEIRQALDQYDLIQANKQLHETILNQNKILKQTNENLEDTVRARTRDLEIQNRALELARAILEDLPTPIVGISAEGIIVLIDKKTQLLSSNGKRIELGKRFVDYFSSEVEQAMRHVLEFNKPLSLGACLWSESPCHIDLIPLSGSFRKKGIVLTINPAC